MIFHIHCNICKIFAEGHFTGSKAGSGLDKLSNITSLPNDIHGAPAESFLVKLSEAIGNLKTLRKMALFWCGVVAEVSGLHWTWMPNIIYIAVDNKGKFSTSHKNSYTSMKTSFERNLYCYCHTSLEDIMLLWFLHQIYFSTDSALFFTWVSWYIITWTTVDMESFSFCGLHCYKILRRQRHIMLLGKISRHSFSLNLVLL